MSHADIIAYNLRDGGNEFTIFADTQFDRVDKARQLVRSCLAYAEPGVPATVIELGCSAGDIVGMFSYEHTCIGYDVTPGACRAARERYPDLSVVEAAVEDVIPIPCDVLILCEFLEHIVDPVGLVQSWLPLARSVVIGHPVIGDAQDPEYGHLWSYEPKDFEAWFPMGGHQLDEAYLFSMGGYEQMLIGRGHRV
jgi:hypothetical protein